MNKSSFFLSNPVDPTYGLELLCGVEEGLHQNDVTGLYQVQTVRSLAQRHQQHLHVVSVLNIDIRKLDESKV